MKYTYETIAAQFKLSGQFQEAREFGAGLINKTFEVITSEESYIFQIVNHAIFKDVKGLSENIDRVCTHIKTKLKEQGETDINRKSLTPIPTIDGKFFYLDGDGNYWRAFTKIADSVTHEQLTNTTQAFNCGAAFGNFSKMLSDLGGKELHHTIPNFHNTPMRIDTFKQTIKNDRVGRLKEVQAEVDFLLEREQEMRKIVALGAEGKLPTRIVHQDTKLSNILFDQDDSVLCVIDLDTVMPGFVCYDFGDAMRNGANTGKEDDPNLDNVSFNFEVFEHFTKGFLSEAKDFLTDNELDTLAFGAKLLTYEQSVRFLDDYINGDTYYKTEYPEHNLVRTRAQIKLLQSMEENYDKMQEVVKSCC